MKIIEVVALVPKTCPIQYPSNHICTAVNFSARILAQLADLDPHMHFSPMKSPESVGAESVVSLLQVHLHQLTKVQDLPQHSVIHR